MQPTTVSRGTCPRDFGKEKPKGGERGHDETQSGRSNRKADRTSCLAARQEALHVLWSCFGGGQTVETNASDRILRASGHESGQSLPSNDPSTTQHRIASR